METQIEIVATPAQIRAMIERAEGGPVGRQATREKAAARLKRALSAKYGDKGAEYADRMVAASDPYDVDRYFATLESPAPDPVAINSDEFAKSGKAEANEKSWEAIPSVRKAAKAGKRAEVEAAAMAGEIPAAPDFSAPTHASHRKIHAQIVAMVETGDVAGLKAWEHKHYSSSQKALARYRDLAVMALSARAAK